MQFDFEKFSDITEMIFPGGPYSLQEVLDVFQYYFQAYEEYIGRPHPPINSSQIARIIERMPYIDQESKNGCIADIDPDMYPELIEQHFRTRYRSCDYNINHFFSGRIRELRLYETCY